MTTITKVSAIWITVLLALVAILFLLAYKHSSASTSDNLSGWTWSENIGWISFNCTNTGNCGSSNYGVNVAANGSLSGYAWSENIGWISFNPSDVSGCPSGTCQANLDTSGNLSGWARACAGTINGNCSGGSRADGWDGWIHLSGTASNGAAYGVSVAACNWSGYAWGSDVVGWIHFQGTGYGVTGSGNGCASTIVINSCYPSPTTLKAGGQIVLWTASLNNPDGTETFAWHGDQPLEGSVGNPVSTTYSTSGTKNGSVTVSKPGQNSKTKTCSPAVLVNPGIISFTAAPSTISPGSASTLSWTSSGFGNNDCGIDQGVGNVDSNGSVQVTPAANTTYTLSCDDKQGNTDSKQTSITVLKEPGFIEIKPQ